jgi:serine/threonine-protein kinase
MLPPRFSISSAGALVSDLSTDRWRAVSPHLDRALDMSREERTVWLEALRGGEPALAADIEELIAEHEAARREGFLEDGLLHPLAAASLAGQTMGAYTLLSLIGEGGMGSVWLAERSDGRFTGRAAIKILNAASIGRAGEERFRREGSFLARLRHPHVAQLIDAGVSTGGQPYLVLEYVEGEPIDRYCDTRALRVEDRLTLFLDVLAAVAHAQANLIVHRDIKPSNVLVTGDGRVKLLDFGIAKLVESEPADRTKTGESALTLEYAAPEQLTGGDVTTATDVYSLGVLLYLLLTGQHPAGSDRASPADLVRAIVETDPVRPSQAIGADGAAERRAVDPARLRRTLRGDLDNIVAKALKKRPAARYVSADAMADDLRRYLAHLPVRARGDSLGYRSRMFVIRHRLALGAAAVAVLALVAGTLVAVWQARAAGRQRDRALVQLQRAEATNDLTSFLLSEATPRDGRPISNADVLARGAELVERRYANDPALRVHMLLTLVERYLENQQYDLARQTVDHAFDLSRTTGDERLRARAACARAEVLTEQGDAATASLLLKDALTGLAASSDAAWEEAICRDVESDLLLLKGDFSGAAAAAEHAIALDAERGGTSGGDLEINAWLDLASAHIGAARFAAADADFRRIVALLEAQGRAESRLAAIAFNDWSAMLQDAGQHERAVGLAERAVRLQRHRDSVGGAALSTLTTYAFALTVVGRSAEAIPILEEAIAKARSAGSPRRLFTTLATCAMTYREAGDLAQAERLLAESEALLKSNPSFPPHLEGLLERNGARIALARGETARAVELAERSLRRYDEAHRPDNETLPGVLALAEAENADGRYDAALEAADRALAMATARLGGMAYSYNIGRAHLERGTARAGRGEKEAAREELAQALTQFRSTVGLDAAAARRSEAELRRLGS